MSKAEEFLNKIIKWGEGNENIRGLIVEGSIAQGSSDELSDVDISIFAKDIEPLIKDDSWISKVASIWVYSPDKYDFNNSVIHTQLVIYEGGVKVDYSLWGTNLIDELTNSNNSGKFETGYKVLLDKDGLLKNLPQAITKYKIPTKPTEKEFIFNITEFWFEAYHVAKYSKREDLWLVKFRDWSLQVYLLTMMEWYMLAKNNWDYDVKWTGKNIRKWLDPEIYERLKDIFSHFDKEDSWKALEARLNLFRDLSKETAKKLGYNYPEEMDKNLTDFMLGLKN